MAFEFETIDDLPPGGRLDHTQLQESIEAFKRVVESDPTRANKWTVLKVGDNKESIAATCSTLRERYGDTSVYGLAFANRPYHKDSTKRAIYMAYDPEKIVEGHAERHEEARKVKLRLQADKAKARKAEKVAAQRAEEKASIERSNAALKPKEKIA